MRIPSLVQFIQPSFWGLNIGVDSNQFFQSSQKIIISDCPLEKEQSLDITWTCVLAQNLSAKDYNLQTMQE